MGPSKTVGFVLGTIENRRVKYGYNLDGTSLPFGFHVCAVGHRFRVLWGVVASIRVRVGARATTLRKHREHNSHNSRPHASVNEWTLSLFIEDLFKLLLSYHVEPIGKSCRF